MKKISAIRSVANKIKTRSLRERSANRMNMGGASVSIKECGCDPQCECAPECGGKTNMRDQRGITAVIRRRGRVAATARMKTMKTMNRK